ncbi:DUF3054 domain-containing protein [Microbacterium sp. ZXX196]|uniref:DUF3054 domain-containing protein n=1 Tax=Microbacterium sp. ZXX196 TaxID=2609291 RepID=UPI0034D198B4
MTSPRPALWPASLAADLVLVVIFAAVGMRSHHGSFSLAALAETAWPFLAGAVLGWLVARGWRRPAALATGVVVWILAAGGGMILRVATGGGFAWSFLVVTLVVLGAFLVGWRAVWALVRRARRA